MIDCINTVELHLTAHLFLATRPNDQMTEQLIRPIFIGPLVTVLTGFHCITVWLLEPGHLEEEYPITRFFENKRFLSFLQTDQ